MNLILLILLIVLLVGGLPAWDLHPYGYAPSTGAGVLLLILLILLLTGRI